MTARQRRDAFLVEDMFSPGRAKLVHWDWDRTLIGGVMPTDGAIRLGGLPELRASSFLERRELGVINLGGEGAIDVGGKEYAMEARDGLYLGRGEADPVFRSRDPQKPACFYLLGYPAHRSCPTVHVRRDAVAGDELGAPENANLRKLCKYFAPGLVETCQLTMGITTLHPGNIWNTMPPHTHDRRSEVYCYFDLSPGSVVFHLMGEPRETAHLLVGERQAVLSPPWSIHSGAGTAAYSFVWGMGGENQEFADMDRVALGDLR